ncbi:hypothetical protein GCM10010517_28150 [Streptosporangium fragile]|uniref:Uncharacterized protein n=1 Tax=Streptosporangium fragile TaxID=46186 RepID=A0ABP6IF36_9ACTN
MASAPTWAPPPEAARDRSALREAFPGRRPRVGPVPVGGSFRGRRETAVIGCPRTGAAGPEVRDPPRHADVSS